MKRFLSLFLSILLLLSLLPTVALAEDDGPEGQNNTPVVQNENGPCLKMECNSQPETSFSLAGGTYEVRFYIAGGPNSPYPAYPTKDQITLSCDGTVVTEIKYDREETVTGQDGSSFTAHYWKMTVSATAGTGSISARLKVDESTTIDLSSISVTSTGAAQGGGNQGSGNQGGGNQGGGNQGDGNQGDGQGSFSPTPGTLIVCYDGNEYRNGTAALLAGEYTVDLRVGNGEGQGSNMSHLYESYLTASGAVSIAPTTITVGGQQIQVWKLTVSGAKNETGTITYTYGEGANDKSTFTITSLGGNETVNTGDRLAEAAVLEEIGRDGSLTAIEWKGQTYYLAAAQYRDASSGIKPAGIGWRGYRDGETKYFGARVFAMLAGGAFALRDDVRAEMEQAGYQFTLTLHPTDNGCAKYPVILDNVSLPVDGTNSLWTGLRFGAETAGRWVYEAKATKDGSEIASARATELCTFENVETVDLTACTTVAQINETIAQKMAQAGSASSLVSLRINFRLPAGELTGQIVVPESTYYSTVALFSEAQDATTALTLRGGIQIDHGYVNVKNIHFVGAGKDKQTWDSADGPNSGAYNYATYGDGQAVYESCVFENYCRAVSCRIIAWGGWDSVFKNNGTAIYLETKNGYNSGGNTGMQNNWFIGNDVAIRVENGRPYGELSMGCCRFVNNGLDFVNNSEAIIWLSQNFFYHGEWAPELWTVGDGGKLALNYDQRSNGSLCSRNPLGAFDWKDYNGRHHNNAPVYECYLPYFGGRTPTYAFPLARTEQCNSFFYPNRWGAFRPDWWKTGRPGGWTEDWYPAYVLQGDKVPDDQLGGGHIAAHDGDKVSGCWDFGGRQ